MSRIAKNKRRVRNILVLTKRDESIIELVYEFRFLTREQLQRLLNWQCVARINSRLRILYDAAYLDRRFLPVLQGSSPAVYFLGPAAVSHLAQKSDVDPTRIKRFLHQDKNYSDAFMQHALAVSEFGTSFRASCQRGVNTRWLHWLNDRQLVHTCNEGGISGDSVPKPDGYGRYAVSQLTYNFFLELDTGSESLGRLLKKVALYQAFNDTGAFRDIFGLHAFRVLFVALSNKRAQSLSTALSEPPGLRIWTGALDSVCSDPVGTVNWYRLGESQLTALHPPILTHERSTV